MNVYLEFEKPLQKIELQIEELKRVVDAGDETSHTVDKIRDLEKKAEKLKKEIFTSLTPWQKAMIARHPERPYTMDYIDMIAEDFEELHGDRAYSDDPSIVGGFGRLDGKTFMIIGHQKGRGTKDRITRNFGQPHPEGYRKALRLMKMAEKFNKPILTMIDTPGAFPGVGAEERGQSEAIANNLINMSRISTPIISVIIGEGGSGGALALAVADRLLMLEHSIYSVISPEGCAAILWKKDREVGKDEYEKAAKALKITSQDLYDLGVIDGMIEEPLGGAHRDRKATAESIKIAVLRSLNEVKDRDAGILIEERYQKFRKLGEYIET
ncbi:MAG: acetyl-CoA carboxylase carboxyltransferase subunit alpha [Nitrospirota bacterium]|nr:MAG: acetyl-CoA carboxylase carboxyltransferase subunit alpha [Nitrospirota bacterium]